jgi:hypothetical protein
MDVEVHQSIFAELADFIISQPTLQDVIDYKVPDRWMTILRHC